MTVTFAVSYIYRRTYTYIYENEVINFVFFSSKLPCLFIDVCVDVYYKPALLLLMPLLILS